MGDNKCLVWQECSTVLETERCGSTVLETYEVWLETDKRVAQQYSKLMRCMWLDLMRGVAEQCWKLMCLTEAQGSMACTILFLYTQLFLHPFDME